MCVPSCHLLLPLVLLLYLALHIVSAWRVHVQDFKSARSVIIHYPTMGNESMLMGLRTGLPARQLAKDIALYQAQASKRITLELHNQARAQSEAKAVCMLLGLGLIDPVLAALPKPFCCTGGCSMQKPGGCSPGTILAAQQGDRPFANPCSVPDICWIEVLIRLC
jgi:hypothetical protein